MIKKISFLVPVIFAFAKIQAQDYLISFAGSGETTTVETVEVENLTQETSLTLSGTDVLHLLATVNVEELNSAGFRIYPNPIADKAFIEFEQQSSGQVLVEVIDVSGKSIATSRNNLSAGVQQYSISNLPIGLYIMNIITDGHNYSSRIVSNSTTNGIAAIEHTSSHTIVKKTAEKNSKATVQMQYNEGDRLLFKAFSGDYITVSTLVPTESSTVTFNFVSATDADGNNYATVTIGDQTWMAENLRVTTYPDGTAIPHVTDNTEWANLGDNNTDDAYSWYDNDEATNGETYGALYTYAAAIGDDWTHQNTAGQGVCLDGWHLPTDTEWAELEDYLTNNGHSSTEGTALKAISGWNSGGNGTDDYGFSALPGGYRYYAAGYSGNIGNYGYFWSATEYNAAYAWNLSLYYSYSGVNRSYINKSYGFSVRCLRD
jgi:uncharacterized protein (TIGR02145 family)